MRRFKEIRKNLLRPVIAAVAVILLAGLLIEGLSLFQFQYAHRMLEQELDYRAESELTLKSVRVRGMLKSNEHMVRNYIWPIKRKLDDPNAIYDIMKRIVTTNDDVMGSFVAFVPNYYPGQGRLLEPCAYRRGDTIITKQLAANGYDYTRREFYNHSVVNGLSGWSDPYVDTLASGTEVVTYATPLTDDKGNVVATFGIDLSTKGIIDTLNMRHNQASTFFMLLTESGRLILQPDSSHTKWHDVDDVVRMINDSTCERKSSTSGQSKIITFRDSENNSLGYIYHAFMKGRPHWQVVMVCYDNEVYGKLKAMRRNSILMMLGGFSLLGFILFRFNRNVQRLHKSNLNKERTDSELRIAQRIQSEMLPREPISNSEVAVSGRQITALEVGGDLYDYFIRDEKLFFCIGDVSGKGIPSSLVMAVVHSHFRTCAQHESNPSRIMWDINLTACQGNETNMFVTLLIGVLDLPTGRLRYCNAGHDAPLIIANTVTTLNVNSNLPVGVDNDFKYTTQETILPRECTLLLYTDGLTETADSDRNLYGLQRIIDTAKVCQQQGKTSPDVLMDAIQASAADFAGKAQQNDDLTMLTVHYHLPDEVLQLDERLELNNELSDVPKLTQFVKSVTTRLNLDSSLSSQIMLAVEEAVVNVINYAYPIGTQGSILLEAKATEEWLKLIITDEGKAFDPTPRGDVDTALSAEERPIGGLGILLVQRLMDSINYERVDGKNILTLKKIIGLVHS